VLRALLLTAVAAAVLSAAGHAFAAAPVASPSTATTGSCPMLKLGKHGQLVYVRRHTLVYRYTRVRRRGKTVFLRRVVALKRVLRTSCARQCVRVVKRGGRYQPVYTRRPTNIRVRRGNVIVIVKRPRATYKTAPCSSLPNAESIGTAVSLTVLPGSALTLDTGAAKPQLPLSGTLRGYVPGAVPSTGDVQITLTRGTLQAARTALFSDTACNGRQSASIRTGSPTTVALDPTQTSTSTLLGSGTVSVVARVVVHLPLELRNNDTGCDAPYITTGYSSFTQTLLLGGKLGPTGLSNVALSSAPQGVLTGGCLSPGVSTQPCNGFQFPLSFLLSAQLQVAVNLPGR